MKVREWRAGALENSIRLENAIDKRSTKPDIITAINVALDADSIIDGRVRSSDEGVLAEVSMRVNEAVLGFRIGGTHYKYKDLRAKDPGMATRQRVFETTGVIIRIDQPWFSGGTGEPARFRQALADALYQMLVREKSIAPHDLDRASTRIALLTGGSAKKITDAIIVYDAVYGGLRLTEPLFSEFGTFIERLGRAAEQAGDDAFISAPSASALKRWLEGLEEGLAVGAGMRQREGELIVYAPGSRVSVRRGGMLIERTLLGPCFQDVFGEKTLVYSSQEPEGKRFVMPDTIEESGQDWRKVYWNPQTGKITEFDAEDGAF